MITVIRCPIPEGALLQRYADGISYADAYCLEFVGEVTLANFVEAFYTSGVFRLERLVLKYLVDKPSTDRDAAELADDRVARFSAWTVEARNEHELLMCDFQKRTRSWFMVAALTDRNTPGVRLFFGSAVVASRERKQSLGFVFWALLGFHKIYSRLLLRAAHRKLRARR